jgi:chorismate mutase-like protein
LRSGVRAVAFAFAFAGAAAFAAGGNAEPPAAIGQLKDAIAARLLLMDDVARYKWNHDLPVIDAARESDLLERTTAAAVALGVPRDYARRVVAAQIAASRARQQELIDEWRRADRPTFADVPDLASAQRPAIDRATAALLTRLRAAMCGLDDDARAVLASPPPSFDGSARVWATAVDPLWPTPVSCRD